MKTILEIQKVDRQIRKCMAEVDKSPASLELKKYKNILRDGKALFEQLEAKANSIVKSYEKASSKFSKFKGNSEILKKRNVENLSADNANSLLNDSNAMLGELSEESRMVEDLVRRAEEIVRKSADLSNKLTEAKKRAVVIKAKVDEMKAQLAPKVAEFEKKIKELESNVKDADNYAKYKDMKARGIFPVFVNLNGNLCGGCSLELSLNFIEKLKTKDMLPCEHCSRIIMK